MARGRKGGPSRLDLRRQAEAAEARDQDDVEEKEEGGEADEEAEAEAESDAEEGDEEAPVAAKKPPKKKAAPKKPAAKRVRAVKETTRRAIWVVYDNASKVVGSFPYNQKAEAEALLAQKQEEKKGTFYLNLVKEEVK